MSINKTIKQISNDLKNKCKFLIQETNEEFKITVVKSDEKWCNFTFCEYNGYIIHKHTHSMTHTKSNDIHFEQCNPYKILTIPEIIKLCLDYSN